MYFLLNQLYLHGQILLFMLTNMICIPIRQEKIKKLLDVFGNVSRSFSKCVKANYIVSLKRRWAFCSIAARAWTLCSRSSREGSSFLCTNKETKQRNSPSALFCLLRYFSTLNKKNSLRSNSFLFLTLRKAPPLHGKKVSPDLYALEQHRFACCLWVFASLSFILI